MGTCAEWMYSDLSDTYQNILQKTEFDSEGKCYQMARIVQVNPPHSHPVPTMWLLSLGNSNEPFSIDIFSKTKTQSIKMSNATLKERVRQNDDGEKSEG